MNEKMAYYIMNSYEAQFIAIEHQMLDEINNPEAAVEIMDSIEKMAWEKAKDTLWEIIGETLISEYGYNPNQSWDHTLKVAKEVNSSAFISFLKNAN